VSEAKQYMLNEGEFKNADYFRKPNLIVADFRLGGQTSLTFVQWLRKQPAFGETPVVMLSGVVSQLDPALFVGLAVDSFLRKSGNLGELSATLRPVLPKC
jgi:DNA-binding response OmpR family regulator